MKLSQLATLCSGTLHPFAHYRKLRGYRSVSHSVFRFCGNVSPSITTLYTSSFLGHYEEYLLCQGLQRNTISFYMNTLRSLYNFALDRKYLQPVPGLFSKVFTGSTPTPKRAVSPAVIARIYSADLSAVPRLEACRDYFLLSLYFQGMPFVDLAYLKKSEVKDRYFAYCRRKTSGSVLVGLHDTARLLLDKYLAQTSPDSPYALPLLTVTDASVRAQYETVLHRQNRQLKALAAYLGLEENLTTYTPRHTWATIAHHNHVDVAMVSQGMGHHSEKVTRIYLDSFGYERLTQVNLIVLSAILSAQEEIEKTYAGSSGDKRKEMLSAKKGVNRKRLNTLPGFG